MIEWPDKTHTTSNDGYASREDRQKVTIAFFMALVSALQRDLFIDWPLISSWTLLYFTFLSKLNRIRIIRSLFGQLFCTRYHTIFYWFFKFYYKERTKIEWILQDISRIIEFYTDLICISLGINRYRILKIMISHTLKILKLNKF